MLRRPTRRARPQQLGVKPGDVVVAVDGVRYEDWTDLVDVVRGQAGENVVLTVERDGQHARPAR